MIILIVVVFSVISLGRLSLDLYPSIQLPMLLVSVQYPNAGPYEIENLVAAPLEKSLASVTGVVRTTSTSSSGNTMVMLEMETGTDMNFATLKVRDRLSMIKPMLPSGATDPTIFMLDPSLLPVMQIHVSQEGVTFSEIKAKVSASVVPMIESAPGVASATIVGSFDKQITINIDTHKLAAANVTMAQIAQVLAYDNITLPGGTISDGETNLSIRITGEFSSIQEIADLPVMSTVTGMRYRLSELSQITEEYKDRTSISRLNSEDSLSLSIGKSSTANAVDVSKAVNIELEKINKQFPELIFKVTTDQAGFIERSINSVASAGIIGAFLAAIIIFLFLRNLKTTLIISASIPISILATMTAMYFANITINLISLGGLTLGIGMLVDNSIVVLENIFRHIASGQNRHDAAIDGTREVAMPITASTLTTIAVFAPMLFLTSITGQIFRDLALTVIFSLTASLLTALSLIPMFASKMISMEKPAKHRVFNAVNNIYKKVLTFALNKRWLIVIITLILFTFTLGMAATAGTEFMPNMDQGNITVTMRLPQGTRTDITENALYEVEKIIEKTPGLDYYEASIGGGLAIARAGSNQATINIGLVPSRQRSLSNDEIADWVRGELSKIPGIKCEVGTGGGMMGGGGAANIMGGGVALTIYGNDMNMLSSLSDIVISKLEGVEGLREIRSNLQATTPEIVISLDTLEASKYGITTAYLANYVSQIVSGQVATRYKLGGTEIDVKIITGDIDNIVDIEQMMITTPTGQNVPISRIAKLTQGSSPISISRENGRRQVTVRADILGRDTGSVGRDVTSAIATVAVPAGYEIAETGGIKQLTESMNDMTFALLIAVLLVFMIIAAQFESLIHPITIMMSIPFSFTGALLLIAILGKPLSIPALIGLVVLSGVVVNNAIVMVDLIRETQKQGYSPKDAALIAGPGRIRPVFMTTMTTILALVPLALALGEGTEMQQPLGISVIGGLTFSTLLTLVVVPVVYTLLEDLVIKVKSKFKKKPTEPSAEIE